MRWTAPPSLSLNPPTRNWVVVGVSPLSWDGDESPPPLSGNRPLAPSPPSCPEVSWTRLHHGRGRDTERVTRPSRGGGPPVRVRREQSRRQGLARLLESPPSGRGCKGERGVSPGTGGGSVPEGGDDLGRGRSFPFLVLPFTQELPSSPPSSRLSLGWWTDRPHFPPRPETQREFSSGRGV